MFGKKQMLYLSAVLNISKFYQIWRQKSSAGVGGLKNRKERKERNVLLQRTKKNARTFRSFAKECENVPFFFPELDIAK